MHAYISRHERMSKQSHHLSTDLPSRLSMGQRSDNIRLKQDGNTSGDVVGRPEILLIEGAKGDQEKVHLALGFFDLGAVSGVRDTFDESEVVQDRVSELTCLGISAPEVDGSALWDGSDLGFGCSRGLGEIAGLEGSGLERRRGG